MSLRTGLTTLAALIAFTAASAASALTVKDAKGDFTIDYTPSRIVALEYSFVDSLAQVGVSPVGVADDNNVNRILKSVRDKVQPWTSVGTRPQPSLEAIAALKPDLIIADLSRHEAVYAELQKIAPVLILRSRYETYTDNLKSAQTIADVVGKSEQMKQRLAEHEQTMQAYKARIPQGLKGAIGLSRETSFAITTDLSYTGSLLAYLGFNVDKSADGVSANNNTGLEQLAVSNPDWLFVVNYRDESLFKKWATEPLYQALTAVEKNQVYTTDNADLWTRSRGLDAAEEVAKTIVEAVTKTAPATK